MQAPTQEAIMVYDILPPISQRITNLNELLVIKAANSTAVLILARCLSLAVKHITMARDNLIGSTTVITKDRANTLFTGLGHKCFYLFSYTTGLL
jgi:hypothetical protein